MVLEERFVFERRSVLEKRPAPGKHLSPRPLKRDGTASRYSFTFQSSIKSAGPSKAFPHGLQRLGPDNSARGPMVVSGIANGVRGALRTSAQRRDGKF